MTKLSWQLALTRIEVQIDKPKAVAVIYTGMEVLNPKIEVEKSTLETFLNTLGLNQTLP